MRYVKRVSGIHVIGRGWYGQRMASTIPLTDHDLAHIIEDGQYTREAVEHWLMLHSGDFQSIEDFRVTISDSEGRDFDSDFAAEESECTWNDCMYPAEEEV